MLRSRANQCGFPATPGSSAELPWKTLMEYSAHGNMGTCPLPALVRYFSGNAPSPAIPHSGAKTVFSPF